MRTMLTASSGVSAVLNHIGAQSAEMVKNVIFRVLNGVLNPGKAQDRLEVVNAVGTKIHELINGFGLKNHEPVLDPRERSDLAGDTGVVSGEPQSILCVIESR